ncbi:phospholipid carrier-dependent glycosyltransferase [Nocardia sp. SYP-A9097]|uniref:ArnT family glycosyltransferase n=1 Tax=Nocardia sp. SYP-A9097 TaxID=2663237 RepID=UPI00132B368E|nr:glycosyltransferase family 39 protein [Nocardia sp. SYP-A9097]MRH90511.1 phospholipid carrier-dependent glycosyltransferase [Nocardia sp. SYP-A9097]
MTVTIAESAPPVSTPPAELSTVQLPPARKWERLGLVVLLVGTAVAYLWNITVNGMGNGFYAAAVWSGSSNWKALLFGSLDPGNFITVDKPPVSQWVMALSGQLFGFSSASMLAPQALMAVAAVAFMYGAVTRVTASRTAGLLAGLVLVVTPVVALMFRFNNPDAVMVLLMTAAAYCTIRALPKASMRWLMLAGIALGFAFLAKMLEGLMVLPALGLAYLVVAPTSLRNRFAHLFAAAGALIVSSGWYVLLTILWPQDSRPYLAGSKDNTFMDLVLGYNGFARYLGHNHQGGRNPFELPEGYQMPHGVEQRFGGGFGSGRDRMFTGEIGFEISWLLPAALLAFVLVLIARGRSPRTDLMRGAALVFGLWLIIDGIAFSGMKGGMHAYYTLAVAPAIAGVLALGVHELWRRRTDAFGRIGGAALILTMGGWAFALLQRNSGWQPWLRWTILAVTILVALSLILASLPPAKRAPSRDRITSLLLVTGVLAGLAGSVAYTAATLPESHTGGGPTVGPPAPAKDLGPLSAFRSQMSMMTGTGDVDPQLLAMLKAANTKWSAAIDRSGPAAGLELASRTSVIAIGGFTSEDPVPTLPQFQQYVNDHQITYYIVPEVTLPDSWRTDKKPTDATAPNPDPQPNPAIWRPAGNKQILDWVMAHYTEQHIANLAVFDLTAPAH